jgi:seryl-tRNA synthetase
MHDIKFIRENPIAFDAGLQKRGLAPLSDALLALDKKHRDALSFKQEAQTRRNEISKQIGIAKSKGDEALVKQLMDSPEMDVIDASITQVNSLKDKLDELLEAIPNIPLRDVPEGKDERGNVERHKFGTPRDIVNAKEHFELGEKLGLMDFETATKISGARFVVLKGALARMERAIASFMLDLHTGTFGYTEVNPPLLVNDDAMFGTGQYPKFADDLFDVRREEIPVIPFSKDAIQSGDERFSFRNAEDAARVSELSKDFKAKLILKSDGTPKCVRFGVRRWLIPTAEVPLTNLVRESILSEEELPKRLTAYTPCFRAEAGAAGRDTRGMIRQHQFSKVELVSIVTPENSASEHERMLGAAEEVLKQLDLPYRVMTLCTGDMGFASQKTYDIEVWLPGQKMYREISSCSQCGDFQARRMQARYRPKGEKSTRFVNTLNGSGLAVGRTLVAILENYQQADGSIAVPEVLQPYMGGLKVITNA